MGHSLPTLALVLGLLVAAPFTAAAQVVPGNCPPPGGSTTETLLCDLDAVLPEGCAPVDLKALGKRVKDTEHIGLFAKVKLGLRAKGMVEDAKEYDKDKKPARLEKLRREYVDLFTDFVKKLDGNDPELIRDLTCAREVGFDLLLKGAALENEKERNGNG